MCRVLLRVLLVALALAALVVDAKFVSQWHLHGDADDVDVVGFNVALKKRNLDQFDARFVAMTTPGQIVVTRSGSGCAWSISPYK